MAAESTFHFKILTRRRRPEDYAIYSAALEWDLTEPIVIESSDDLKSEQRWKDLVTPYHHQVTNLITFCRRLPVTLLADDVGLGKTISAGLIASELITRGRLSKILIVCPKVLCQQWQEELSAKFNIDAQIAIGRDLVDIDPDETGAIITTYNSARLHLENLPPDRFQMLVLDEAHKLRNLYGVESPPQVAKKFRAALQARRFRFVLMLTATPIQNRLWDIYSLVDLLTVARGHQNPFGSEGQFVRRFVEDAREGARKLKPEARDDFRSIVYGYMSRVRRGDAKLTFPDRVVQLHNVKPTNQELELIQIIAKPIQKLNKLVQISILQALVSSPEALKAQLINMARKGSVPEDLAYTVKSHVDRMPRSSKLESLSKLIEQLRKKNPSSWRAVIFTTRRETQTTIQLYLESLGLKVGTINGDTASRNHETIKSFWSDPPENQVIVSTEAGSEGVNLQIANVLVNYDLPWNPMVVEQRIGRIQRLNSKFAHVNIFNMVLTGTFEEYIVGRLMEKLQMAAHAIGDIEALLQGADVDDGDAAASFEDQILQLVLSSLAGQDSEKATKLKEDSIERARQELEQQESAINDMLGSMDNTESLGPRAPKLPPINHRLAPQDFVCAAFDMFGGKVVKQAGEQFLVEERDSREFIHFDGAKDVQKSSTLYAPSSPAYSRLVSRVLATGIHDVSDLDSDIETKSRHRIQQWTEAFEARLSGHSINSVCRTFLGKALLRIRVTVAHDSYERVIEVDCRSSKSHESAKKADGPIGVTLDSAKSLGIDTVHLVQEAENDPSIAEFVRFYLERRELECAAAASDDRKRKKLFDEFTPRLQVTLVGLRGGLRRELNVTAKFRWDGNEEYSSEIEITPSDGNITKAPPLERTASGLPVPTTCLETCTVSGERHLRHRLLRSDESGRYAKPEYLNRCDLSGKRALASEMATCSITNRQIVKSLTRKSDVSGRLAESSLFEKCHFTNSLCLNDEIRISQSSSKKYRADQEDRSAVSNKRGHTDEFIACSETRQKILRTEAQQCAETRQLVAPGVLETCMSSGKQVLPQHLKTSDASGKRVLSRLLVKSSISGANMLREEAVVSMAGRYCLPSEAKTCTWSNRSSHPDDLQICAIAGLPFQSALMTQDVRPRFRPLVELLDGTNASAEATHFWDACASVFETRFNGKCRIESAVLSPTGKHLIVSCEIRTLFGLKTNHAGGLVELPPSIIGRAVLGKRNAGRWKAANL